MVGVRLACAGLAVAMSGCSVGGSLLVAGVRPVILCHPDDPMPPTYFPPVIDSVIAAGFAVGAATIDRATPLLVPASGFAISAVAGYVAVAGCRDRPRENEHRIDCAAVKAKADELRARDGGTIRDQDFLMSPEVQHCFGNV